MKNWVPEWKLKWVIRSPIWIGRGSLRWCKRTVDVSHLVTVDSADQAVIPMVSALYPESPMRASRAGKSAPTMQIYAWSWNERRSVFSTGIEASIAGTPTAP